MDKEIKMAKLRKDMTAAEKKKYNANINEATTKTVVTKSGVKITGTGSSSYPKKLVQGSMTTGPKFVEVKPPKKASTSYSPAPMTAAQKNKIKFDAAAKAGRLGDMKRAVGTSSKPAAPAKKGMSSGGKAFTPEQLAILKKMMG